MNVLDFDTSWRHHGGCNGMAESGLWFSENATDVALAKAICDACPVERECLDYALAAREPIGTWGGKTEDERRAILRIHGTHPGQVATVTVLRGRVRS